MKKLPEWGLLIKKGLNNYRSETLRTLRHIFRSLWVYYAFINERINLSVKKENLLLLKDILIILNHIRNAISHSSNAGIVFIEGKGLRVRDFKSNGELSFEKIYSYQELYDFYYTVS